MRPATWGRALLLWGIMLPALWQCGRSEPPIAKEIQGLQLRTCVDGAESAISDLKVGPSRVTATWTCGLSRPWTEYLARLDELPGYRRSETSPQTATYRRATETDYYILIVTASVGQPDRVQIAFAAGPY
jgi:hypothetical protein